MAAGLVLAVYYLCRKPRPERRAILADKPRLSGHAPACQQLEVQFAAALAERLLAWIPRARRFSGKLSRAIAEYLLKLAIAADDRPIFDEDDAHRCRVEDRILLLVGGF